MKRARLIYNPTSGREEFEKRLPDILNFFEDAGFETSCHATKGAGDATQAARLAVKRKFDLIIAAGGDGTLYEVVNGMAEQEGRPPLGIIPSGTTNDFARAIGLPMRNIPNACEVILNGASFGDAAVRVGENSLFLLTNSPRPGVASRGEGGGEAGRAPRHPGRPAPARGP